MTADFINLRKARKAKIRSDAGKTADENRVRFGEPASERKLRKAEDARAAKAREAGLLELPSRPSDKP